MRIAIVNDMKMTVEMLRRIVTSQPSYELAWVAYDGAEAVEKCKKSCPDLILMDLIMPVLDGVQATKQIMQFCPCAILIVTASVGQNASKVFEAMGFGALDVVKTPVLDQNTQTINSKELVKKMERIALLVGKPCKKSKVQTQFPLLLIGASTGGPMALRELLSHLPKPSPYATLIAQHVDEQFSEGLASWLKQESGAVVRIAKPGDEPTPGVALLAGSNDHLILTKEGKLAYTEDPIDNPYRPSVDVLFSSFAAHWKQKGLAILLTGMGADGAKGMKALHDLGWHTIAQDEASCIVFGMPKAAIAAGAVSEVLSLREIGPKLLDLPPSTQSTPRKI